MNIYNISLRYAIFSHLFDARTHTHTLALTTEEEANERRRTRGGNSRMSTRPLIANVFSFLFVVVVVSVVVVVLFASQCRMNKRKRRQKIKQKRRAHLAHFVFYFLFLVSYFISYLQLISLSMHSVISNRLTHRHTNTSERTYTKLCPKIKDYHGISYFIFVELLLLLFLFSFTFQNVFLYFLYISGHFCCFSRCAATADEPNTSNICEILKTSCAQKRQQTSDGSSSSRDAATPAEKTRGEFA